MPTCRRNVLLIARVGAIALAFAALPVPSRAQVPAPHLPDTAMRSGLISRFLPIESTLPPDKKRDSWYNTRWGDSPNQRDHPNFYKNGGLYGLPWRASHTKSVHPFFFGSPGQDTIPADYRPAQYATRLSRAIFHPFKPVGMYYDQGSYVPIYDLDPIVPGPGAWPFPFYISPTHGGG